jgi:hypothetical protein
VVVGDLERVFGLRSEGEGEGEEGCVVNHAARQVSLTPAMDCDKLSLPPCTLIRFGSCRQARGR